MPANWESVLRKRWTWILLMGISLLIGNAIFTIRDGNADLEAFVYSLLFSLLAIPGFFKYTLLNENSVDVSSLTSPLTALLFWIVFLALFVPVIAKAPVLKRTTLLPIFIVLLVIILVSLKGCTMIDIYK